MEQLLETASIPASARAEAECPVVGVGASAGGLEALTLMFEHVAPDIAMAFIVVQHLDPDHESMMAELVGRKSKLRVIQVCDGDSVAPGVVHVIPPGHALRIRHGVLSLSEFTEPRGVRRPIDDFFVSLAEDQQKNAACVILSGTGSDGAIGLRSIKEKGGLCVAQTPETARYDGMPMSAVGTGMIDHIAPANEIVAKIKSFFDHRSDRNALSEHASPTGDHIDLLCAELREVVGHDFSGYKRSTMARRVERRMQIIGIVKPSDYVERVSRDEEECQALFRDLLIHVTSFFRDSEPFAVLYKRAIEPLVRASVRSEPIRIWVPGCSSGEEAYTIAMLFQDCCEHAEVKPTVQIFATDIDEHSLVTAREGRFPASALADIPEKYRARYLSYSDAQFTISPVIRDMVRFSPHSIIKDPAFSRIDLISCRNMLIYLGDSAQTMVVEVMHYALKAGGFLFLGPSESVSRREDLFAVVDQRARLYRRRDISVRYSMDLPVRSGHGQRFTAHRPDRYNPPDSMQGLSSVGRRQLLAKYAPPSITVSSQGRIVESTGRLTKYFEFRAGETADDAIAGARKGLREELAPLLRAAETKRARIARRNIVVVSEFGRQEVALVADPLPDGNMLVVFLETADFEADLSDALLDSSDPDDRAHQLEEEVQHLRHRLRVTTEELETANEELKSSNEEMMSMNEELQSTNEELITVNDELKSKIDRLGLLNDDLTNFLDSTDLAVVIVDNQSRIRSFTPKARAVFPLNEKDKGRHLGEVASLVANLDPDADIAQVLASEEPISRMIASLDGSTQYHMRVLPYRSFQGSVKGATLTFSDVSELKKIEGELKDQRERLELALTVSGMGVWQLDFGSKTVVLDEMTRLLFALPKQERYRVDEVTARICEPDRQPVLDALRNAFETSSSYSAIYRVGSDPDSARWVKAAGRIVVSERGKTHMVGVVFDIDMERRADQSREIMLREMNHRVKNSFAMAASLIATAKRQAGTVEELATDVQSRIASLVRAHDVTQSHPVAEARSLRSLIEVILEAYSNGANIELGEGDLLVPYGRVTPLGLILHEWMTNSAKHGALALPSGTLSITWSLVQKIGQPDEIRLNWRELRGESELSGEAPVRTIGAGFGTRLIQAAERQLQGTVRTEVDDVGFVGRLSFPV